MEAPTGRWAWLQRASHHFEKGRKPFFVAPPHHIIASPDVCVLSHPIIPPLTHQFCHSSPHKSYQRPPPPTNQTPLAEMLKSKIRHLPFREKTVIFALAKGRRPVTKASSFFFCPLMRPDKSPSRFFNSWTCKFNSWTCNFYSPCRNFHTPCERFHTPNGHSEARI